MQLLTAPAGPLRWWDRLRVAGRTVPPAVAALAGLAMLPTVLTTLRGGHDFNLALLVATIVTSCGIAVAVDDPAAATLEASPSTLVMRRGTRAAVIGSTLLAAWGASAIIAAARSDLALHMTSLGTIAAAGAGLALAIGSRARTDEPVVAGFPAAFGGALSVLVIGALNQRFPDQLPRLIGETDGRWLLIALVSGLIALRSTWRH